MSDKKRSLEEQFEDIEGIINQMEKQDNSLDKTFELYKSGLEMIQEANAMLDDMEKTMMLMKVMRKNVFRKYASSGAVRIRKKKFLIF